MLIYCYCSLLISINSICYYIINIYFLQICGKVAPTWIVDEQFGPHASQLVVSYSALHQPRANCGGSHLHCAKHSWMTDSNNSQEYSFNSESRLITSYSDKKLK